MHNFVKPPAIVLAAFGTSSALAREVYSEIELRVRKAYPENEIRWAYLSSRIADQQRARGIHLPMLTEVLSSLRAAGAEQVVVQPLLVMPGEEFKLVKSTECAGLATAKGEPLLSSSADITAAATAISSCIRADIPNVVVCHGNKKHAHYNVPLLRLKEVVEGRHSNVIVASIEGEPGSAPLVRAREMAASPGAVVFIPFMIVAGEHVLKDVMGNEPNAWKQIVGASHVECLEPLGRNTAIIDIYLNHIEAAMQKLTPVFN